MSAFYTGLVVGSVDLPVRLSIEVQDLRACLTFSGRLNTLIEVRRDGYEVVSHATAPGGFAAGERSERCAAVDR